MNDTTTYHRDRLAPLMGCRIVAIVIDASDDPYEPAYVGFHLYNDKTGFTYEVVSLRDPEGNGPGHLTVNRIEKDNEATVG